MDRKLSVSVGLLAVVLLTLIVLRTHSAQSQAPILTPTPAGLVAPGNESSVSPAQLAPAPSKVTDLAPQMAESDKAALIIRHQNGSREKVLMPPAMIDAYRSRLPATDRIDVIIPPRALIGHAPGQTVPAPGVDAHPGNPGSDIGTPPGR